MPAEKTTAAAGRKRRRSPATATKKAASKATKTTKTSKTTSRKSPGVVNSPVTPPPTRILLVDNGGHSLKYGWIKTGNNQSGTEIAASFPHSIPNVSARLMHQFTTLVGDELNRVQNPNSLVARNRSMERGMICNLENQTRVWKRMLDLLGVMVPTHTVTAKCLGWKIGSASKRKTGKLGATATTLGDLPEKTIPPQTIGVILLLPPHYPRLLLDQIFTVWMEDFCVSHVGLGISSAFASHDQSMSTPWKTSCTVDLGWSSTIIVPTFQNKLIPIRKEKGEASDGTPSVRSTIRRMPFGGRHMVNMMKYYMSYRQYNLMDQELIMRDVFERLSYISTDMKAELKIAQTKPSGRRPYDRDFVLPDYSNTDRGEIRIPLALQRDMEREEQKKKDNQHNEEEDDDDDDEEDEDFGSDEGEDDDDIEDENFDEDGDTPKKAKKEKKQKKEEEEENADSDEEESMEEKRKRLLQQRAEEERRKREQQEEEQVLRVSVERFTIPEVLFRPIDAGLQGDLVGLPQAIVQSVQSCPECYRPALYRSVYLVGGVALLPNLIQRLERELRTLVPSEYEINITVGESPMNRAWVGAKAYFEKEDYTKSMVSRKEWEDSSQRRAYKKLLIDNAGNYT